MNAVILDGTDKDDPEAESMHDVLLHALENKGYSAESIVLHQLDARPFLD